MSDTAFALCVRAFIQRVPLGKRMMANAFEVAESTVERWASGVSYPMPRLQKQIVSWIDKQV